LSTAIAVERIFAAATEPGWSVALRASASVLDNFHDMAVALTVTDGLITSVEASMNRFPKTTCPGAVAALAALRGCRACRVARVCGGGLVRLC
jgi:hypothetical protein